MFSHLSYLSFNYLLTGAHLKRDDSFSRLDSLFNYLLTCCLGKRCAALKGERFRHGGYGGWNTHPMEGRWKTGGRPMQGRWNHRWKGDGRPSRTPCKLQPIANARLRTERRVLDFARVE
jgi:hypothetical protein